MFVDHVQAVHDEYGRSNMDVALVSAIAWFVAMVNAFKYYVIGAPYICLAVTLIKGGEWRKQVVVELSDTLDVTMITSSLLLLNNDFITVGSKK